MRIPIIPELMISWESGDDDRLSKASASALDCEDWEDRTGLRFLLLTGDGKKSALREVPLGRWTVSNPVQCPEEGVEGNIREAF